MNGTHIYLEVCLCFFAYLFIANIIYVYGKFSNLPWRVRRDGRMMCATVLCETFRTLYLTMGGVLLCFKFWAQDTSKGGYYEDLHTFDCDDYRYISIFVQSGLIILLRFLFTYSRLYQMRRILQKKFGTWNAVILSLLISGECVALVLTVIMAKIEERDWNGITICWVDMPPSIEALWITIITLFELVMLWLYIYPLYQLDKRLGGGLKHIFVHRKFQKEKNEKLIKEDSYLGLSLERPKLATSDSKVKLHSAPILLKRYHRSVRRNFWSGIFCVLVSIQYVIGSLSITNDSNYGKKYWYTGAGIVHLSLSFFLIYGCLVLSYRDWSMAFLPFQRSYSKYQSLSEPSDGPKLVLNESKAAVVYKRDTKMEERNSFSIKKNVLSFEIN